MWNKIRKFHQTRQGYLIFGVAEAVLAYFLILIAVDTANMLSYLASAVLVIGSGVNMANAVFYRSAKRKIASAENKHSR